MFRISTLALATGLIVAATAAEAGWARSGSATGPRGNTWTGSASGSCSGGTCSTNRSVTGPYGNSVSRNRTGTCSGGTCTGTRSVTGPYGGSVTRSGTITRY